MVVQHNLPAMNAHRNYGMNTGQLSKSLEKLSSGYRINRAADDAAGLAISEKMRSQIRGLDMAERNCADAISLIQTGEGALNEVHAILQRGRELLVQATNGTYTVEDREQIQLELNAITSEIDRIAQSTKFNGIRIFTGTSGTMDFDSADYKALYDDVTNSNSAYMALVPESDRDVYAGREIYIQPPDNLDTAERALSQAEMAARMGAAIQYTGSTQEELITYMQDYWIPNAMQQIQDTFQSFEGVNHNIYVTFTSKLPVMDTTSNPWALCAYSGSTDSVSKISIVVDLDDFISGGQIVDGSRTIAHELMHAFMAEVMPGYMMDKDVSAGGQKRAWFTEGMADLAAGNSVSRSGPVTSLTLTGNGYDAYDDGYLACAYASYLASGSSEVSAASISYGMDLILAKLRETGDIDKTFQEVVGVSITDFETQMAGTGVTGASKTLAQFHTELAAATKNGAGAVMAGNLSMESAYVVGNHKGDYTSTKGFVFHFSNATTNGIHIQAGANGENVMRMQFQNVDAGVLGIRNVYAAFDDSEKISRFIEDYDNAIRTVSSVRAEMGAMQNRLEHTLNNLGVTKENLMSAESVIRDTDMAKQMMQFTQLNVLTQAAQAMMAQANALPQGILGLLQ